MTALSSAVFGIQKDGRAQALPPSGFIKDASPGAVLRDIDASVQQADGKARKTAVQQLGVLNENRTGPERVCPVTALTILDSPHFSV